MRKYKIFTNFDKEERWLEDLASQGYRLVKKTSFGYEFERTTPENTSIKMDFRIFRKQEDFEDYRALFEDSGWEHLAGTKGSGYQYFKQKGVGGRKEIFSDVDSKAARYKRLSEMWGGLACSFAPIFAVLVSTDAIDPTFFVDPKSLYLTPGLWEMSAEDFWGAFLFETPFALARGLAWMSLPVMVSVYLYFAWKANRRYLDALKE